MSLSVSLSNPIFQSNPHKGTIYEGNLCISKKPLTFFTVKINKKKKKVKKIRVQDFPGINMLFLTELKLKTNVNSF